METLAYPSDEPDAPAGIRLDAPAMNQTPQRGVSTFQSLPYCKLVILRVMPFYLAFTIRCYPASILRRQHR
jgi:hypothetical protein